MLCCFVIKNMCSKLDYNVLVLFMILEILFGAQVYIGCCSGYKCCYSCIQPRNDGCKKQCPTTDYDNHRIVLL
jgi:hypothetical protein